MPQTASDKVCAVAPRTSKFEDQHIKTAELCRRKRRAGMLLGSTRAAMEGRCGCSSRLQRAVIFLQLVADIYSMT